MGEILIVGDFFPTEINEKYFIYGDIDHFIDKKILGILREAEYRIANLEGVLGKEISGIKKSGPCLKADPAVQNGIKKFNFDMFSLANNHVMDYGSEGLFMTLSILSQMGIKTVGAGDNLKNARKVQVITLDRTKIGILACAESEFTIATEDLAGANPFDELTFYDDIVEVKKKTDYLIVIYHGGKEYYQYPAPYLQRRCRRMAEKGVDLILCQHSHCIGCYERYKDSIIVYGQGNFLMNRGDNQLRNTGLMIHADAEKKSVDFIPVCKTEFGVRLADENEKKVILTDFEARSAKITDQKFVACEYTKYAKSALKNYQLQSLGKLGRILHKLNMDKVVDLIYDEKTVCNVLNLVRCEAHNDLYREGLNSLLQND